MTFTTLPKEQSTRRMTGYAPSWPPKHPLGFDPKGRPSTSCFGRAERGVGSVAWYNSRTPCCFRCHRHRADHHRSRCQPRYAACRTEQHPFFLRRVHHQDKHGNQVARQLRGAADRDPACRDQRLARRQAEAYAGALPVAHSWAPPVCDVYGQSIVPIGSALKQACDCVPMWNVARLP